MEEAGAITEKRLVIWKNYHHALAPLETAGVLRRPIISADCQHNAHMYYILPESLEKRTELINRLQERCVHTVFHYVPLHNSPTGKRYGKVFGSMANTVSISVRLLRLPLWVEMTQRECDVVFRELTSRLQPDKNEAEKNWMEMNDRDVSGYIRNNARQRLA